MGVFQGWFLMDLERRYLDREEVPYSHWAALSPRFAQERERINSAFEAYTANLQLINDRSDEEKEHIANDLPGRLRSEQDEQHFSALHELATFEILKSLANPGEAVIPQPVFEGMTPDYLFQPRGTSGIIVEALRIGDEPEIKRLDHQHNQIRRAIQQVQHKVLRVWVQAILLPDEDLSAEQQEAISHFLEEEIRRHGGSLPSPESKSPFRRGGLELEFTWIHVGSSGHPRPIYAGGLGATFWMNPLPPRVRAGIEGKLSYCRIAESQNLHYILAIGIASRILDVDGFRDKLQSGELLDPWVSGCLIIGEHFSVKLGVRQYRWEFVPNEQAVLPLDEAMQTRFRFPKDTQRG